MLPAYLFAAAFALGGAKKAEAPSSFMLVSGVSASQEMCLVGVDRVGVALDDCGAAVDELDGREVDKQRVLGQPCFEAVSRRAA